MNSNKPVPVLRVYLLLSYIYCSTLNEIPSATVTDAPDSQLSLRTCVLAATMGYRGLPVGITTSLLLPGNAFGNQLAGSSQTVLTSPVQLTNAGELLKGIKNISHAVVGVITNH